MTYCPHCPQLTPDTIILTSDLVLSNDSKQYRCYIGKVNKQNINKLTFVLPNASKDMVPMALCWPVHGDMLLLEARSSIGYNTVTFYWFVMRTFM